MQRQYEKAERKAKAYLNKKYTEYDRKCKNEIRKLEWKPEKVYKVKKKKVNLWEFAMDIQQENAKLRDTDSEGRWFCISCDTLCSWWDLAWWHRRPRSIRSICLNPMNINAQCHTCNLKTWPLGNVELKYQTNKRYDENLDKKYGKLTSQRLAEQKELYFSKQYERNWGLDRKTIEKLIEENEERWKSKNFYKPKKNWRRLFLKYFPDTEDIYLPKTEEDVGHGS